MFVIIEPFPLFADIITICLIAAVGLLNMNTIETAVHRVKFDTIPEHGIHMSMWCSLFAYLVTHTPVNNTGELGQQRFNTFMVKTMG